MFFHSILTIFFSSMEVIGKQNVPTHGPVIFTGNHMNQFVDGAVIVTTNPRNVGFLVAEKSMKKPLIGDFARACGSIPVARPQDKATAGPGKIYFDKMRIYGEGTQFTKLVKGDKIRPAKSAEVTTRAPCTMYWCIYVCMYVFMYMIIVYVNRCTR